MPDLAVAGGALGQVAVPEPGDAPMEDVFEGAAPPLFAAKEAAARMFDAPHPGTSQFVRVYARVRPTSSPGKQTRSSFEDVPLWAPGVFTSPTTGKASVALDLPDQVTTFRLVADALSHPLLASPDASDGTTSLGSVTGEFAVTRPLVVTAKVPPTLTQGDVLNLPVTLRLLVPGVTSAQGSIHLNATGGLSLNDPTDPPQLTLQTTKVGTPISTRTTVPVQAHGMGQPGTITVDASVGQHTDSVEHTLPVLPSGFPWGASASGTLKATDDVVVSLSVPSQALHPSMNVSLSLFPSAMSSLTDGLESLLSQPCGCFEQTSSTTYPLAMALFYMRHHSSTPASMISRAERLLEDGYKRLVGYEITGGGFEWFGVAPAHEALSAYGALQLLDIASVWKGVDAAVIERCRSFLLARKDDAKGGFHLNDRALDTFGAAPEDITWAYILWALTTPPTVSSSPSVRPVSAIVAELGPQIAALTRTMQALVKEASPDPYKLALGATALLNTGEDRAVDLAHSALDRLAEIQSDQEGSLPGGPVSIVLSGEHDRRVETTALAALAWMHPHSGGKHTANAAAAVKWILTQRSFGRFGATQATVLALKAITVFDIMHASTVPVGSVVRVYKLNSFSDEVKQPRVSVALADQSTPGGTLVSSQVLDSQGSQATVIPHSAFTAALPGQVTHFRVSLELAESPPPPPEREENRHHRAGEISPMDLLRALGFGGGGDLGILPLLQAMDDPTDHERPPRRKLSEKTEPSLSFSTDLRFRVEKPADAPSKPFEASVVLESSLLKEGGTTTCRFKAKRATADVGEYPVNRPLPMLTAVIGIPAGLSPRQEDLREAVAKGLIAAYELAPSEVVLYWRGLAPEGSVDVSFLVTAEVPGTFQGQASRAWLYYDEASTKQYLDPLRVVVTE
jgi:alpha-2-macroglobulin-like protein